MPEEALVIRGEEKDSNDVGCCQSAILQRRSGRSEEKVDDKMSQIDELIKVIAEEQKEAEKYIYEIIMYEVRTGNMKMSLNNTKLEMAKQRAFDEWQTMRNFHNPTSLSYESKRGTVLCSIPDEDLKALNDQELSDFPSPCESSSEEENVWWKERSNNGDLD